MNTKKTEVEIDLGDLGEETPKGRRLKPLEREDFTREDFAKMEAEARRALRRR